MGFHPPHRAALPSRPDPRRAARDRAEDAVMRAACQQEHQRRTGVARLSMRARLVCLEFGSAE